MCTFHVYNTYNTTTSISCLCSGVVLQMLALASSVWSIGQGTTTSKGLYFYCYEDQCFEIRKSEKTSEHAATETLATVGFGVGLVALGLSTGHTIKAVANYNLTQTHHNIIGQLTLAAGILSGFLILVSLAVYMLRVHNWELFDMGYAAMLSAMAGFLIPVGAFGAKTAGMAPYKR